MNDALKHIYEGGDLVCMGGCGHVYVKEPPFAFCVMSEFTRPNDTIVAASCHACMEKNQHDPRGYVLRHMRKKYPDTRIAEIGNG